MRKTLIATALTALAFPTFAGAQTPPPNSTDFKNAAKYCKALRTYSVTADNFRAAVDALPNTNRVTTRNAYGKCVSSQAREEAAERKTAHSNAAKTCDAQRDDPNWRSADNQTFADEYGTGPNKSNAYGRCVSQKAKANKAAADAKDQQRVNAARACRAEQKDPNWRSTDNETFAEEYGTNANNRNAFGKCVSRKAQAQNNS